MKKFNAHFPVYVPDFIYSLAVRFTLIYRRLRYSYTFRKIPLTQGKYAIVDVEDYEQLIKYNWGVENNHMTRYASRKRLTSDVNCLVARIKMHRQIINVPEGKFVDHINHNGLDNRKTNLRIVSQEQNDWNRRKRRGNYTSKYKGIRKKDGKWHVRISHKKIRLYLGAFDDELAAARAYDAKAKELFKEYACLNFPE